MANMTGEVTSLGCFKRFETVSCVRDSIEASIAVATAAVCVYKVIRLYIDKLELWDQYAIFTLACLECIICAINWLYINSSVCDFIAELLKLLQFLVVCSYYCQIACRVSKRESLYKKYMLPILGVVFLYFVALVTVGIVDLKEDFVECLESEWLQLSISEFVLGLLFIVAGIYITRKVGNIVTELTYKKQVRYHLWGIILTFQLSALCSVAYDVAMLIVGAENQCKGVFVSQLGPFTAVHFAIRLLKWMLPIWAMMVVFSRPSFASETPRDEENEPPLVRSLSDGPFFSQFRPRGPSFHYKHLVVDPSNDARHVLPGQSKEQLDAIRQKVRRKKRTSRSSGGSHTDMSRSKATTPGVNSINSDPSEIKPASAEDC